MSWKTSVEKLCAAVGRIVDKRRPVGEAPKRSTAVHTASTVFAPAARDRKPLTRNALPGLSRALLPSISYY